MARKTKEEAEQTRLRILAAAEAVFCRRGVAATTLHDIACQAGVTRGAVYWHFSNKDALLATLLESRHFPLEKLTPGANLADDCERLLHALLATLRDPAARCLLRILLQEAQWGEAQPYIHGRIMRARRHFTRYLEQMLQQALAAGELPKGFTGADIAPTALALKAIVRGLVYEFLQQPRMPQHDDQVCKVMHKFFGMLERHPAAQRPWLSPT